MKWIKVKPRKEKMFGVDSHKPHDIYPSFSLPLSALPEMKDWNPGESYEVSLKIDMTGLRITKTSNGDPSPWGNSAEFDVKAVSVKPNKEGSSKYDRIPAHK